MRELWWVVGLVACAGDLDGTDVTDEPIAEVDPCAAYSWETVGAPFMLNWCSGCHGSGVPEGQRAGAPVGIDLDEYDSVVALAERVRARAIAEDADMPPTGGPSATERGDLETWLDCGAP